MHAEGSQQHPAGGRAPGAELEPPGEALWRPAGGALFQGSDRQLIISAGRPALNLLQSCPSRLASRSPGRVLSLACIGPAPPLPPSGRPSWAQLIQLFGRRVLYFQRRAGPATCSCRSWSRPANHRSSFGHRRPQVASGGARQNKQCGKAAAATCFRRRIHFGSSKRPPEQIIAFQLPNFSLRLASPPPPPLGPVLSSAPATTKLN